MRLLKQNSFFHALPPTLSNAALKKDEDMKNAATVEVLEQHVRKWIEVREKRESLQSQLSSNQPKSFANSHEISAQHRNCQSSAKQAVSRILSGPKKQPTTSTKQSPPTRPLPTSTNLCCNYCKQAGHTLFHFPTKPARPPRFGPRPFGQQQQQFLHSNANRFASLQRRNNGAALCLFTRNTAKIHSILHVLQEAWSFGSNVSNVLSQENAKVNSNANFNGQGAANRSRSA